jgi:HPt (histidine-containing phosphotransfer) domain-containing protein
MADMGQNALISDLASDEDMIDLVEEFVGELPKRAAAVKEALTSNDMDSVRRLAHQLKGAAGGYGFGPISQAASMLEDSLKAGAAVEQLRNEVAELAGMCQRARAR